MTWKSRGQMAPRALLVPMRGRGEARMRGMRGSREGPLPRSQQVVPRAVPWREARRETESACLEKKA
jgi:hypothetical protein